MIGVNGWYSANQRTPGRHRARGHERAAEERQELQRHRQVAGGFRGLGDQAEGDRQPGERERDQRDDRRTPRSSPRARRWAGSRPARATPMTSPALSTAWITAAGDVPGQHRGRGRSPWCGTGSMMPSVMSTLTATAVDTDCRGRGHHDDPGRDVVDVDGVAAEAGAERAAEDVDEQQQQDDGHAAAPRPSSTGSAAGAGGCAAASSPSRARRRTMVAHRPGSFRGRCVGRPVRAKKTSSRSGV